MCYSCVFSVFLFDAFCVVLYDFILSIGLLEVKLVNANLLASLLDL